MGTGRVTALSPPKSLYKGKLAAAAAALAFARDTPRIALAPRSFLLGVPSRSIIA